MATDYYRLLAKAGSRCRQSGRSLIDAHDDLIAIHGAWSSMVENDLPFGRATAQKLMEIARHPTLSNVSNWKRLPAQWTTLYQLSQFEPTALTTLIESGEVTARTTGEDVKRLRRPPGGDPVGSRRRVDQALSTMNAGVSKAMNVIYNEISSGEMSSERIELALTAFHDLVSTINEFIDIVQGKEIRPMETVETE
jgi:hypothetical protein